jgi:hypothetical protein
VRSLNAGSTAGQSNYFAVLGVLYAGDILPRGVHSHKLKETDELTGKRSGRCLAPCLLLGVALCTFADRAVYQEVRQEKRQMRYVSIRAQAYSIRLRRNCLFNLTYQVTRWREGSERWFLVGAQEAEDLA